MLPIRVVYKLPCSSPRPGRRPHHQTLDSLSPVNTSNMPDPLTPLSPVNANRNPPANVERVMASISPAKRAYRVQDNENMPFDPQLPSSPFVEEPSPFKMQPTFKSPARTPKKKVEEFTAQPLTEDALRENDGLARTMDNAIDPSLGRRSPQKIHDEEGDNESAANGGAQGYAGMDDTCFSAFSAVPNADMTRFANLGRSPEKHPSRSPTKHHSEEGPAPRPGSRNTPSRNHRQYDDDEHASPTPRRHKSNRENGGDTTNLLVDFTDQYITSNTSDRSPIRQGHSSPKKFPTQPDLSSYNSSRRTPSPTKYPLPLGTPNEARHLANLLDFDIPSAPTPRSIPSISARELESMKSQFLSQVSSLTATLSGKDAEVGALKKAVTDAERRVGEAQEQIRDERSTKEGLAVEKAEWEKRQGEMQAVLKDVKEEIIRGDREKDTLLQRVHEADHKREEAESHVVDIEAQLESMRANATASATPVGKSSDGASTNTSSEVEAAVTKVAKELHGLYKSKHEAKVTALKKSYSDRWEKKVRDLSTKIEELTKENEDLRVGRDATMSSVIPSHQVALNPTANNSDEDTAAKRDEENRAALQQQQAEFDVKLRSLQTELSEIQSNLSATTTENTHLKSELADSRAEITSLVEASEELMLLSTSAMSSANSTMSRPVSAEPPLPAQLQHSQSDIIQKTFSRSTSGSSSGLQRPGFAGSGESRIGRMGGPGMYSGSGRERSGSGLGRSGGILSNIERMGRGRDG